MDMRGKINMGILVSWYQLHPESALGRDAKNVDQDIANTSGVARQMLCPTWPEQKPQYLPEDDAAILNPDGQWTGQNWVTEKRIMTFLYPVSQSHSHFRHPLTVLRSVFRE